MLVVSTRVCLSLLLAFNSSATPPFRSAWSPSTTHRRLCSLYVPKYLLAVSTRFVANILFCNYCCRCKGAKTVNISAATGSKVVHFKLRTLICTQSHCGAHRNCAEESYFFWARPWPSACEPCIWEWISNIICNLHLSGECE